MKLILTNLFSISLQMQDRNKCGVAENLIILLFSSQQESMKRATKQLSPWTPRYATDKASSETWDQIQQNNPLLHDFSSISNRYMNHRWNNRSCKTVLGKNTICQDKRMLQNDDLVVLIPQKLLLLIRLVLFLYCTSKTWPMQPLSRTGLPLSSNEKTINWA